MRGEGNVCVIVLEEAVSEGLEAGGVVTKGGRFDGTQGIDNDDRRGSKELTGKTLGWEGG